MDRCPTEILAQIVSFSCFDGGSTACALRLTSKYMCAVTEPYKFLSVCVAGSRRLESLVNSVRNTAPKYRRVEHLLVSDIKEGLATAHDDGMERAFGTSLIDKVNNWEAALVADILCDILRLVRHSLRNFTCLVYNPRFIDIYQIILCRPLPVLTALTIRTSSFPLVPRSPSAFDDPTNIDAYPGTSEGPLLPKLERLHIAFGCRPTLSDEAFSASALFSIHANSLTAIRFTNVRFCQSCPAALARYLNPRNGNDSESLFASELLPDEDGWVTPPEVLSAVPVLPSSVSKIFVQPVKPQHNIPWWSQFQQNMIGRIKDMDGERFTLLPMGPIRSYEEWKDEWRETVVFGTSMWAGRADNRSSSDPVDVLVRDIGALSLAASAEQ